MNKTKQTIDNMTIDMNNNITIYNITIHILNRLDIKNKNGMTKFNINNISKTNFR